MPNTREHDFCKQNQCSEAELAHALVGFGNHQIRCQLDKFFPALEQLGPVMALSRNGAAVHEKTGTYGGYKSGTHASVILGDGIDLRIFPKHWRHAYHVEKRRDQNTTLRSFQFFDAHGQAVHKIYERYETDRLGWDRLLEEMRIDASDEPLRVEELAQRSRVDDLKPVSVGDKSRLLRAWSTLQDTHQFQQMIRRSKLSRVQAIAAAEGEFSTRLAPLAIDLLLNRLPADNLPIMVFVRNHGTLQIHSGPIQNVKRMGNWLNVLDEGFHMHLRDDLIDSAWIVRKPTKHSDVFSLELFDQYGEQVVLLNGDRRQGDNHSSVQDWNAILSSLPTQIEAESLEAAQ